MFNNNEKKYFSDTAFRTMKNGDIVYRDGLFNKEYIVTPEQKKN